MKPLTAIAISGGVDSLMAGYLLKEQGHDVIAIHFRNGYNPIDPAPVADQLGLPLEIVDVRDPFKQIVVDYFTRTYQTGQTPNPCMVCNPAIKFGLVFDYARKLGATKLATGHYARVTRDSRGHYHLLRGLDTTKDQSYFLARINRTQLARTLFPLGTFTKKTVRKMAASKGFFPATQKESQDVCFIGEKNYGDFLVDECCQKPQPGSIEDVNGNLIGEHQGLHRFTIGQRRGINCPAAEPYYVVRIDMQNNRLIVGFKQDLYATTCRVENINWIDTKPESVATVFTKVRYRHTPAHSRLDPIDDESAKIIFSEPQSAITPGQGAVFYRNDEVLGGGWIASAGS